MLSFLENIQKTIEIITKAVIIKNNKQHSGRFSTQITSQATGTSSSTYINVAASSPYSVGLIVELFYIVFIIKHAIEAAPQHEKYINRRIWPPMKHYDIWSTVVMDSSKQTSFSDDPQVHQHDAAFQNDQLEFVSQQFKENIDYWHSNNNTIENNNNNNNTNTILNSKRRRRVLHLFPVPVDGECLSDDGRRTGNCHNAYECRKRGGAAKGECAMGFGVCCIFVANCNTDTLITNNITYLVSPNFPSFMPQNLSSCNLKVKLMENDVSQLRIDFFHFSLGQPNRRTGFCDGDVFNISGGPGGTFSLCGQNSGQHIYYDVGGRSLPRQTLYGSLRPLTLADIYPNLRNGTTELPIIEISMNFTTRFLPQRLWEIRISQIPFSQRAPAGCLQYFMGTEGVLQTFNFADNGRHLANQNYRICMRQETDMCSILYQPCDDQSFRIGPINPPRGMLQMNTAQNVNFGSGGGSGGGAAGVSSSGINGMPGMGTLMGGMGGMVTNIASTMASMLNMGSQDPALPTTPMITMNSQTAGGTSTTASMSVAGSAATNQGNLLRNSTVTAPTTPSTPDTPNTPNTPNTPATTPAMNTAASSATSTSTAAPQRLSTTTAIPPTTASTTTASSSPSNDDYEDDEGSGAGITPSLAGVSRRPQTVSGGFDILGFLRSTFAYNRRQSRQLMSNCRDRITMPCIIEDFIGTGLGPLPGCEPVHCGAKFCTSGLTPCRIESTVTPFYIGIHFGDGTDKGSAEDNIGACIRYNQVQCM